MNYIVLIVNPKDGVARESVQMAEMGKYAGEMRQQGRMVAGAPLQPENEAARVSVRRGLTETTDGPFAESKEVIGGYFMLDAASRAEAIELAKRCPATRSGVVAVHEAMRDSVPNPPEGKRHMLLFLEGPDFDGDPDGSKYREMEKWTDSLKAERKYVECAGLPKSPPGARIESLRGKTSLVDGPFAETKEIVGGYAVVVAPTRAESLAIAARCPHAKWGVVEVREVMDVPR
jgi:hypothetical protein